MSEFNKKQEEFEAKWLYMIVSPTQKCLNKYKFLNDIKYLVTSALYEWEQDDTKTPITTFAIMAQNYSVPDNPAWYTFKCNNKETQELDEHFTVLEYDQLFANKIKDMMTNYLAKGEKK